MRSLRSRSLLALAAIALVVSACSSDGGSEAGSAPDADDPTTTTARAEGEPLERYAGYESKEYDDPSHWVCRPDQDDICDSNLDATVVEADGTLTVEPFEKAEDPPIDCFYVYPTISRDQSTYADWDASDEEEGYVTLNQAARLQSQCRVFAPVYRQLTLNALGSRIGGEEGEAGAEPEEQADPFGDVLDAFSTYMANDNDGRGVVLIGHSQGAAMLNQLIASEFDPNDDVRDLLVGAYLAGGAVAVPEGQLVGGDFEDVPLCSEAGETGCIDTWATFRADQPPPPNSFFGRPRQGEGVAGCTNPAAPGGGEAELDGYFPADSEASILSALGTRGTEGGGWLEEGGEEITTPYVRLPGLVSGECTSDEDFNYLAVTVHPDDGPRADDVPGDLSPEWGLHLIDVNVVMGDIVERVAAQAEAYGG